MIQVQTPDSERWVTGWDLDARECADTASLVDADCERDLRADVLGGGPDSLDNFPELVRVPRAHPVVGRLRRPVSCAQPHDRDWLADQTGSRAVRESVEGRLLYDTVVASDAPVTV